MAQRQRLTGDEAHLPVLRGGRGPPRKLQVAHCLGPFVRTNNR